MFVYVKKKTDLKIIVSLFSHRFENVLWTESQPPFHNKIKTSLKMAAWIMTYVYLIRVFSKSSR